MLKAKRKLKLVAFCSRQRKGVCLGGTCRTERVHKRKKKQMTKAMHAMIGSQSRGVGVARATDLPRRECCEHFVRNRAARVSVSRRRRRSGASTVHSRITRGKSKLTPTPAKGRTAATFGSQGRRRSSNYSPASALHASRWHPPTTSDCALERAVSRRRRHAPAAEARSRVDYRRKSAWHCHAVGMHSHSRRHSH